MKNSHRIWTRADGMTGLLAWAISFAVYYWSTAPNVTLLDSGEFMVAAQHFGVPHPTGYPLWTILTWLFQLLPLGNSAWEINLFSGVCASLAVGLAAALLSSIQSWCFISQLTGCRKWLPYIVALAFSLMLAFSESMWSQAVIAEVYALHALLVAIFLLLCYIWVRNPARDGVMYLIFFILALAFSNHHLTLTLAPLPYILILLLRRRMFFDWLFAGLLTILMAYFGFAILSSLGPDPGVPNALIKTALRFFYLLIPALAIFAWVRRGRVRWRFIAFLPFVMAAGLLPYLYMPFASSTNPPMNWGYAREPQGFFFSINRSQYSGSLSDLSLKTLGRLLGSKPDEEALNRAPKRPPRAGDLGFVEKTRLWIGFFWFQLLRAFFPVGLIGYFASILFVFRFSLEKRVWIYLFHLAFILAAFAQPMTMDPRIDNAGWWLQMPFHTYTNLIFATLSGLGVGLIIERLTLRRTIYFWLAPLLLVLPIFTFRSSEPQASQRERWFGWMFGRDMLWNLPPGSIMIGGTDPGRFVPTYMIFGESFEPARFKRDPDFDRRDLYIITQNALGEPNYMKYLRDQYTTARPEPRSAFERWLGRAGAYPKEPINLPTEEQVKEAFLKASEDKLDPMAERDGNLIYSSVLHWLWEHNKDKHDFFIEESFPLSWTYDYAIPHGLIYQLSKTKLDAIPKEAVERDFAFWKDYKATLLNNPSFKKDRDAMVSFSRLRQTTGNIYRHRKMDREAELAYREALELWPNNVGVIANLMGYMGERGEFDAVLEIIQTGLDKDPNDFSLWQLLAVTEKRKELDGEISSLVAKLKDQPKSRDTVRKLIELYGMVGETNKAQPIIQRALRDFPGDTDLLREIIIYHEQTDQLTNTLEAARQLASIESSNVDNKLLLARAYFLNDRKKEFYETATEAVSLGGEPVRKAFAHEPMFTPWREQPEFQKLVAPPPALPAQPADPAFPAPER